MGGTAGRLRRRAAYLGAAALLAAACGGSADTTDPSPSAPSTTPVATTLVTVAPAGVTPVDIVVAPGTQVTFVNSDSRSHQMASDPHPDHTDCPEINQVGFLAPGDSRQTGNMNTVRVCGYH